MKKTENAKNILKPWPMIGTMANRYLADQYLPGLQSNNPDRMCSTPPSPSLALAPHQLPPTW